MTQANQTTENQESIVSAEEMSALLNQNSMATNGGKAARRPRIVAYDFRRPDRLSKEQVRSLFLLHDMFARSSSSSLPVFLRTLSEVTLLSVEQLAYAQYLGSLPDPTALFAVSMNPLDGMALLELSPAIAFPVIDRMLGGAGGGLEEMRSVTEIEQRILESFLSVVIDDLRLAWRPLVELDLDIVARETRPQMLQIVAPNEVVLVIVFEIGIGEARGRMSLCIPAQILEPLVEKFTPAAYARASEVAPAQTRRILDALAQTDLEITAELRGTRITASDLLDIQAGDVLRLDSRIDAPLQITVGGIQKFCGAPVNFENRTAVQLTAKN